MSPSNPPAEETAAPADGPCERPSLQNPEFHLFWTSGREGTSSGTYSYPSAIAANVTNVMVLVSVLWELK